MPSKRLNRKLIGNLSEADARHILSCEGGELSPLQLAFHLIGVAAVAGTTAWAISAGHATAWHLALPMVAQYLALLVALPLIYLFVRHPDLRKDVVGALRLWAGIAVALAIATFVRSRIDGLPWQAQLSSDFQLAWTWITDAHMQWPILIALVAELAAIPGRVRNLYKFGPPFSGVSLGCAMRFGVLMLGCALLPFLIGSGTSMAWTLWWMILVAEILTLWMLCDIQHQLRKRSRGSIEPPAR